jgi:hypothetical protein
MKHIQTTCVLRVTREDRFEAMCVLLAGQEGADSSAVELQQLSDGASEKH